MNLTFIGSFCKEKHYLNRSNHPFLTEPSISALRAATMVGSARPQSRALNAKDSRGDNTALINASKNGRERITTATSEVATRVPTSQESNC